MSTLHFFDAGKDGQRSTGNPEKTLTVHQLIEIPREQRDQQWIADFIENIDECLLKAGDPEIVMGNDGFPYMNLKTSESGDNSGTFVLTNELDRIIQHGFGVTINAGNGYPDWLFSCGDLLNYRMNGEFYTDDSPFSAHGQDFSIPEDEQVLVGQPSEEILPEIIRRHIREFLESVQIHHGKILLMARNYESETDAVQDLVFNLTPDDFSPKERYQQVMQTIAWFLPRHYSIVGLQEDSLNNGFEAI